MLLWLAVVLLPVLVLVPNCCATRVPQRIGTECRQAVTRQISAMAALLPLFTASKSLASPPEDSISGIDFGEVRGTVNAGRVYVHDGFISKDLLDELRADVTTAKERGAFQPSGLSNRASTQNVFDTQDRLVTPVLGSGYTSAPLLKVKTKLDEMRVALASSLDRPTMADEALPHELYYSISRKGAFLKRHMDERHEELKGRNGYLLPSRRSLSFLVSTDMSVILKIKEPLCLFSRLLGMLGHRVIHCMALVLLYQLH